MIYEKKRNLLHKQWRTRKKENDTFSQTRLDWFSYVGEYIVHFIGVLYIPTVATSTGQCI